jgi:hypothetical protein
MDSVVCAASVLSPCITRTEAAHCFTPLRDLLCPHPAQQSSSWHPATAFAAPSPHPMALASTRPAPRRWSRSPAWPLDGSARPPHSVRWAGNHRPDAQTVTVKQPFAQSCGRSRPATHPTSSGRKTLGVSEASGVELLFDTGSIRFEGAAWTTARSAIAIFDSVFVAENVHSGDVVDIEQKRNLYRVIVGDQGVKLAEEDVALAQESRAKTVEITSAASAVQPHLPAGSFVALPRQPTSMLRLQNSSKMWKPLSRPARSRIAKSCLNFPPLIGPRRSPEFWAVPLTIRDQFSGRRGRL